MSAPLLPDRITPLTQAQFSETYGGSLICCMFSLPIYGISLLQVYMYYLNYPRDSKWIKTMVALLVIFESAHTWMTCHTIYHYSILSYSNPLSLIDGEWSVYVSRLFHGPSLRSHGCLNSDCKRSWSESLSVASDKWSIYSPNRFLLFFLIQIYFSRMVYLLAEKSWKLAVIIIFSVLIVAHIGFGIYVSVKMFLIWDLPNLKTLVHPGIVPLYCIRLVSDAIIAVALCVVLYDASSRSMFKGSNRLFKTLMVYAMNRFILTTVVVIVQNYRPHCQAPIHLGYGSRFCHCAPLYQQPSCHTECTSKVADDGALSRTSARTKVLRDFFLPPHITAPDPNRVESMGESAQVDIFPAQKHGVVVEQDTDRDTYTMSKL
ncbi:hypothetical protein B0H14DRAFT_1672432 [Mycena olivaceomarginata]|nr:hypothetical protein B0H14DRAFT_1672432 [Mycena olivaceomarginata]